MIRDITIEHYGLIHNQHLVVAPGLCVVTGETGAGKSMLLAAIGFLFGEKLPAELRSESQPTRVCCRVDARYSHVVLSALDSSITQRLPQDPTTCLELERRHQGNKTHTTLAGVAINRSQLKQLADSVLHVHQQHQHLRFLQTHVQRDYLDCYGQHREQLQQTKHNYGLWQQLLQQQVQLEAQLSALDEPSHNQAIVDDYFQQGLDSVDLDQLHQRQKQLQSRQAFIQAMQQSAARLDADDHQAVLPSLYQVINDVESFADIYPELSDSLSALHEAMTLLTDAHSQIRTLSDGDFTDDAQAYADVESQLADFYQFARKYQQPPEQLGEFIATLSTAIEQYHDFTLQIARLKEQVEAAYNDYLAAAKSLHDARCSAASTLANAITSRLPSLALPHAKFAVLCRFDIASPSDYGCDSISFTFSANTGIAMSSLERCASGGELTRLALLLQLSLPQAHPKLMVFDEADVGVSGASASLIGSLLKQHATSHPVLCITHSPQVAAKADTHWYVTKQSVNKQWYSAVRTLSHEDHVHAVATLLGDESVTDVTLANAKQLCEAT